MNGRKLATSLYKIEKRDFFELGNNPLKSIYFYLGDNLEGATVTENKVVLINELKCLKIN